MIKMLMILVLMTACNSLERKLICKDVQRQEINSMPFYDVSFQFNRCRVRCFNLTDYTIVDDSECGPSFVSGNYPLSACEGVQGFITEEWAAEVRPKLKNLRSVYLDECQ